jgi:hypothetical protein
MSLASYPTDTRHRVTLRRQAVTEPPGWRGLTLANTTTPAGREGAGRS